MGLAQTTELLPVYTSVGLRNGNGIPLQDMPTHAVRGELRKRGLEPVGVRADCLARLDAAREHESAGAEEAAQVGAVGVFRGEQVYLRPYEGRISERDLQPYPNANARALWPQAPSSRDANPNLEAFGTTPATLPSVLKQKPCACMACKHRGVCSLRAGRLADGVPDVPDKFGTAARLARDPRRAKRLSPPKGARMPVGDLAHRPERHGRLGASDCSLYLEAAPDRLVIDPAVAGERIRKFRLRRDREVRMWAAASLQRVQRGRAARHVAAALLATLRATVTIGRFMRGYLGRRKFQRLRLVKHIAAIHIQAVARRWMATDATKRMRQERTVAAMVIARVARGRHDRRRWRLAFEERSRAALVFQAVTRSLNDRRHASRVRTIKTDAVMQMQAMVRGALHCTKGRFWFREWHGRRTAAAKIIQRSARCRQLRTWMPRLKKRRDTSAVLIQKRARGLNHRMGVWRAARWRAAEAIQGWLRRFHRLRALRARIEGVVHDIQIVGAQAVARGFLARRQGRRLRLRNIMEAVAALRIQTAWAAHGDKKRRQGRMATRLQASFRGAVAYRNYKLTRRKLRAQDRILCREGFMRRVDNEMQELDKVLATREDFWPGDVGLYVDLLELDPTGQLKHPVVTQSETVGVLLKHRAVLRKLYVGYSIAGNASADKLFKFTKGQFRVFVKAVNPELLKDFDDVFMQANAKAHLGSLHIGAVRSKLGFEELEGCKHNLVDALREASEQGRQLQRWNRREADHVHSEALQEAAEEGEAAGVITGLVMAKPNEAKTTKNADLDDKIMIANEFVHAITILADLRHRELPEPTDRLEAYCQSLAGEAAKLRLDLPPAVAEFRAGKGPEVPAIQGLFDKYNNRLIRLFRHYKDIPTPDVQRGPNKAKRDLLDAYEWMFLCSECHVLGQPGRSFSKVSEAFIRCNQEELDRFYTGTHGSGDPNALPRMGLDYNGMLDAILATAALTHAAAEGPNTPLLGPRSRRTSTDMKAPAVSKPLPSGSSSEQEEDDDEEEKGKSRRKSRRKSTSRRGEKGLTGHLDDLVLQLLLGGNKQFT